MNAPRKIKTTNTIRSNQLKRVHRALSTARRTKVKTLYLDLSLIVKVIIRTVKSVLAGSGRFMEGKEKGHRVKFLQSQGLYGSALDQASTDIHWDQPGLQSG